MKLRQLFIIAGLFLSTHSYGQVYEFIVCGSRGANSVKTGGEWKLLKSNETLDHFDEIKTDGSNCYLGLLHSSGRSIVIRKPGTYREADLLKEVNTGTTAVASKYADFVFTRMMTVSSISQSSGKRAVGDNIIKVYLPVSGQVFGNSEIICWEDMPGSPSFRVRIRNMFDDIIAEYTTDKPMINLNFNDAGLKNQNAFFLIVEIPDNSITHSSTYGLTRLSGDQYNTIEKKFKQLISELNVESPINNLIISSFFEDNNLLIDAATYYYKFLTSSPDMKDFESMYDKFLARNGMK